MKALVRAMFVTLIGGEILLSQGIFFSITPDFSWLGLIVTSFLAWIFIELANLPGQIGLIVFGDVVLDAISDTQNLYSKFAYWDTFLHAVGGSVVGIIAVYLVTRAMSTGAIGFKHPVAGVFFSVICIVALAGLLYELQEYLTDLYYLNYQKQLGDGPDTVVDQIMNVLGGAMVAEAYILKLAFSPQKQAVKAKPVRPRAPRRRKLA